MMMPKWSDKRLEDSFMSRVRPDFLSECWIWTGTLHKSGYGRVIARGLKGAGHLSVYLFRGEMPPKGLVLMHSCDVPTCVNPDHLSYGTQSQNIKDAVKRGRLKPNPPRFHFENHPNSKMSNDDRCNVLKMRRAGATLKELAQKYDVSIPCIHYVCRDFKKKEIA